VRIRTIRSFDIFLFPKSGQLRLFAPDIMANQLHSARFVSIFLMPRGDEPGIGLLKVMVTSVLEYSRAY
jgi:hypothetical protein